ncbi:MAG TPA: hypothetical protein VGO00_28710 [Kofleriaceae bacterium]|nr:hypothetical protein [Kofleriaceae bacterium]
MRYAKFVIPILTGCFNAGGGSDGGCNSNGQIGDPPFGGDDDFPPFQGPQPDFGPTVTQPTAPPAISGGTLAILANGTTAVVSDPDRDHIYVADLTSATKLADIALQPHDEPGRIVEDAAGRVHVVLRGGALATLDPTTWTIATRRSVCPAPRGVAYEAATDLVHVACAGGELVSLPAAGGDATRTVHLDLDLRDVVVHQGHLVVSTFRSANLLTLDASGQVTARNAARWFMATEGAHFEDSFEPGAAWRIATTSDDKLYMLHQRALAGVVEASSHGGYGGADPCGDPIVHAALTPIDDTADATPVVMGAVVAVDFAFAHTTDQIAIVSAGNSKVPGTSTIVMVSKSEVHGGGGGCIGDVGRFSNNSDEPVAVAFTPDDHLVVQSRQPATLFIDDTKSIVLSTDSRADTGHAIFHANAGASIACASCHLEGSDDGRAWSFDNTVGARRTQSLRGGISGTEPFHWDGDQTDFPALMTEVFGSRMAGPTLTDPQLAANVHWIDQIPLIPQAAGDIMAVARGKALFEDANNVGCVTCHNGPKLTNNLTVDVGTGARFQVARLVGVAQHAPFLHDGRARTLADRFDPSLGGGEKHGHTAQLSPDQLADLMAYLGSL